MAVPEPIIRHQSASAVFVAFWIWIQNRCHRSSFSQRSICQNQIGRDRDNQDQRFDKHFFGHCASYLSTFETGNQLRIYRSSIKLSANLGFAQPLKGGIWPHPEFFASKRATYKSTILE
jgi:hypothetical protein